jgi:hypothetical protein
MFVAQGSLGRTIVSCDDGLTWVGDHSWDVDSDPLLCEANPGSRCYESTCSYTSGNTCDQVTCCDHSPDVAKGVAFGDGDLVATWGWGRPGEVRRSVDASMWQTTLGEATFGGVAYGGGRYVLVSRDTFWSTDGVDWTKGGEADFRESDGSIMWSARAFAYADYQGGGRFVAVASGNLSRDMLISSDGGETWWRPTVFPDTCAVGLSVYGGIVSGNDIVVIVDYDGNACRSTDGGLTWSVTPTGLSMVLSHGVWTGTEFAFWGDDTAMITSPDGASWTVTPMTTPTRLGPVAYNPQTGTFVATGSVWNGYENQQFMRSTDGLSWEPLSPANGPQGHPIFYITHGRTAASELCPSP